MALELKSDGSLICPVAICDICDGQINRDSETGFVVYRYVPVENRDTRDVLFVHRGACDRKARAAGYNMWRYLHEFLAQLSHNIRQSNIEYMRP